MTDLNQIKNNMCEELYGIKLYEALEKKICVSCRENAYGNCYSELGIKEYHISGLCEKCYDELMSQA